jgi:PilZ domain
MTDPRFTRRRRFPRLLEVIPAHFRLCGRRRDYPGSIVSLGAGGAAVLGPVPVPLHSTLKELRFTLPPIRRQRGVILAPAAIVRWIGEQEVAPGERWPVIGVEFLDLRAKAFDRIRTYVYYRLLEGPVPTALGLMPATHSLPPFWHAPVA